MKGINLKDSVENFGTSEGFKFWFRWSFSDPLKMFWWKYITAKPVCTYHGYFLCDSDCQHEKITGRKNILAYHKKRNQQLEIESKTIRGYNEGKCNYCGELFDAQSIENAGIIDDPNWNTLERWLVCKTCKEVIELQREISFPLINTERQQEINERLLKISQETGKPIIMAGIDKKGVSSVTYEK